MNEKESKENQNEHNKKLTEKEVKKSLTASTYDGAAYSVMAGTGDNYIPAYIIALNANNFVVGLATAIPQILAGISQLLIKKVANRIKKRKDFVIQTALINALLWFVILGFSLIAEVNNEVHALTVVLLFGLSFSFATIANPVWASWMSDLVPENIRGTYFGKRNAIAIIALVFGIVLGGIILNLFYDLLYIRAFSILFLIAAIARLVSVYMLNDMYDPELTSVNSDLHLKELLTADKWKLGRNVIVFIALIYFTTNIAGPFFAVYMLKDLKLDYINFMGLTIASIITKFFSMPYWGRLCDRLGNKLVLSATGLMIPFIPMLWLVSNKLEYLYAIQLFSGFVWGGFEIVAFNYVLSASHKDKRVAFIAIYNFVNYLMVFLGSLLGGYLVVELEEVVMFLDSPTLNVIFISGVCRFIVYLLGIGLIENTTIESLIRDRSILIKIYATYPFQGIISQIEETFESTINTLKNGTDALTELSENIVEKMDKKK
ncbi:MAG: MFS transporter [Candidatus Micrarchaeota archaeon]|nr:MFS transporter [Candidatus Micrarchaeota archaeon]